MMRICVVMCAALELTSCSTPEPKPDPEPVVQSKHQMVNPLAPGDDDGDGMKVEGTLGTLDQSVIEAGLNPALLEITSCFNRQQKQEPYLGGQVTMQFRVARDGAIKSVRMQRSSLGSMEVDRCILEAAHTARFQRPRGGEAEFSYSLELSGRIMPVVWNLGMVRDEITKHREDLSSIRRGRKIVTQLVVPSGLEVTMYIDRRGHVVSVGMIAVEEIDQEFAAHLVATLKTITFEQPNSPYAKVTFTW